MSLARRLRVSSLRASPGVSSRAPTVAVWRVPIPGLADRGYILHNTKTPLTVWFWAAYLAVTDKRGLSALLLQRQLGLTRYETAWMLLHKLRRAMVNAAREPCMATWRWTTPGWVAHNPGSAAAASSRGGKRRWCCGVEKRGDGRADPDGGALGPQGGDRPAFVSNTSRPARRSTPMRTRASIDCRRQGSGTWRGTKRPGSSSDAGCVGRSAGRSRDREPATVADRHLSRRQQAQLQVYLDEFVFDTTAAGSRWRRFRRCSGGSGRPPTPIADSGARD